MKIMLKALDLNSKGCTFQHNFLDNGV